MLDTILVSKSMALLFQLEGNGYHGWGNPPWHMSGTAADNDGHSAGIEHIHMIFFTKFDHS